jgi:lipopolysaccharide transport system ATP-binding protein
MSDTVIRVENLSKLYRIGKREEYHTLRDSIARGFSKSFRFRKHPKPDTQNLTPNSIWALKDVSFEIKRGEVVGIIGRNGAGKSTLLKILSRITEPTEGYAEIRGRVGSLLEVGTGFHAELTGRENIFLNGAILGMKKAEIKRKFDEIVAFAEIEKFIDTPVKHYSSGMYVRLAFAVAAHLEPEILFIDEVLAVGDIGFQKKCLGKMEDLGKEGRTVLFISHNMAAISRLCGRGILLQNGGLIHDSTPDNVIMKYNNILKVGDNSPGRPIYGDHNIMSIQSIGVRQCREITNSCKIDEDIVIEITYVLNKTINSIAPNINLVDESMNSVFCSHQIQPFGCENGKAYLSSCRIPKNFLQAGIYYVDFAIGTPRPLITHVYYKEVYCFNVVETWTGKTARGLINTRIPGIVAPLLDWKTDLIKK